MIQLKYISLMLVAERIFSTRSEVDSKIYLTASVFETGSMATLTKLWNTTILGLGVPPSTQCSQTSRFRHWHPLFGDKEH
jgi:hypothetical protein